MTATRRGIDIPVCARHNAGVSPAPLLRRVQPADTAPVTALVHGVLHEFGLAPDSTGTDVDLTDIAAHFVARGGDFVVLTDAAGHVVGTCGLFPLEPGLVELRKMYLAPAWRGRGQGRRLLEWALTRARELGFRRITLETASAMHDAIALYERAGFTRTCGGAHSCRCDLSYARDL